MTSKSAPTLTEELAAALDWWREAGVDRGYRDEAQGWLADPAAEIAEMPAPSSEPAQAPAPAAPPQLGGDPRGWPDNLAAFRRWWLEEPTLDDGGGAPRVPPRGERDAEVMVLVAQPEEGDRDTLLAGREGEFLTAILSAMRVPAERAYVAAALPRHTTLPDWDGLRAAGLGRVLDHHIALAAPRRVIGFGRIVWPFLGHDPAQSSPGLPIFNHEGGRVMVLGAYGLERMLRSARLREQFWRRWLDWTDGTG